MSKFRGLGLDLSGQVEMIHGSGGRAMAQLIEELFGQHLNNELLEQKNDQALFNVPGGKMVMTTDGYVISPIFFPGGDIGALSVHGTVNDIAMAGAKPLYLSAGFILEEGFPLRDLEKLVVSMAKAAKEAGVWIVTGDTKVVEKGHGDGVFITTTGIGVVPEHIKNPPSGNRARPGDRVLVSGSMGDHGMAVMCARENLSFETALLSDHAALNGLVEAMTAVVADIHVLRDPTRGGLGATLNEIANQSGVGITIYEKQIPLKREVKAACELLGLDPLYVANEGKLIAICAPEDADKLLAAMQTHSLGKEAAIVGEITEDANHFVQMQTAFGGKRIVDWLTGEQLPRIC